MRALSEKNSEVVLFSSENTNFSLFEDDKTDSCEYGMSVDDECINTYGGDSRSRGWASLKRGGGLRGLLNPTSHDRKLI